MSALPVPAHAVAEGDRTEQLLEVLVRAQQRESELEAAYAEDRATAAQLVELERVRGKYVQQFSGGELQRIAIARALIPRPKLIVADEPVSMVDASLRMTIVNLFTEIRAARGVSFIYITHDLSTATYVADRIVIMTGGGIVEQGVPAEIAERPRHDYTRLLMDSIPRIGARWPEIEVHASVHGHRAVTLRGRFDARARTLGVTRVHLSTAHANGVAVASAVLEAIP